MQSNETHRGGAASRFLIGILTALAMSAAFAAGPASATTVYDYVYSGEYFDGSGAGQTFDQNLRGIDYDRTNELFYVTNGGTPGTITKIQPDGTGVNFAATGTPRITTDLGPFENWNFSDPSVSIDQTGGPYDGNFYAQGGPAQMYGFDSNGDPFPEFQQPANQGGCGVAVLPPDGSEILVSKSNSLQRYSPEGEFLGASRYVALGVKPTEGRIISQNARLCRFVVNDEGAVFGVKTGVGSFGQGNGEGRLIKIDSSGLEIYEISQYEAFNQHTNGVAIDASTNDVFALRENNRFEAYDEEGRPLGDDWGGPEPGPEYLGLGEEPKGIAVDPVTHDVWVANRRNYPGLITRVEKFERTNPHIIPGVTANHPGYENPTGKTVELRGTINPDEVATTDCHFEYGLTQDLGTSVPCDQGNVLTGNTAQEVTATIPVEKGNRYWFKLFSQNANEQLAKSNPEWMIPQYDPIINSALIDRVNTDGARFRANFNPNGGNASVQFEWGTEGNFQFSTEESDTFGWKVDNQLFSGDDVYEPGDYLFEREPTGLTPGTTYEFRAVVTNEAATIISPVSEFTTYLPDPGTDPCPNATVRQQTEASLLPDCRAYELASTDDSGGYDVVSDLIPGQAPLAARPRAQGGLLYSVKDGLIPGVGGSPTNLGLDPYVATRGASGWTTEYVGLPSNGLADEGAYGSPLLGADPLLRVFAFGGQSICDPCFPDNSVNVPLRRDDGTLVKGMAGTSNPAADPVGEVRKRFSDDGEHFIFGADEKFEAAGNEGSVSIYERDLSTSTTQVVSTMPGGTTMTGDVAGLDVSADGSRVLIGKKVGEDPAGNDLHDLYMHVGTNPSSVEVADTASGVIFNGMTADGTTVYFTTPDALAGDSDTSTDLYVADVGASSAAVSRVSTGSGGTGNTDACSPLGFPNTWNSASGDGKCGVVAFAGGAGVAEGDGTVYFVSPEQLDGAQGEADEANLYVAGPAAAPEFVATIDTSAGKAPPPPPLHPIVDAEFSGALSTPKALEVDQGNGDVYVITTGDNKVQRFTAAGAPKNFTAGPGEGTNAIPGLEWPILGAAGVAVDNSGGPSDGNIYVAHQNFFFEGFIDVFSPTGEPLVTLTGAGTPGGAFGFACGVTVDDDNGDVYVGDYFGSVWRYSPAGNPVEEGDYSGGILAGFGSCKVAAAAGKVWVAGQEDEKLNRYLASEFEAVPSPATPTFIANGVRSVATDSETGDAYVAYANKVDVVDDDPEFTLLETFASGEISNSQAVAVRSADEHVFASSGENKVLEFGKAPAPYSPVDHYAIANGVEGAAVHNPRDFQVTPDGRFAAFTSEEQLTSYNNRGQEEILRYDTSGSSIDCPSCAPTGASPSTGTTLSAFGSNMSDDGRVFYTTLESFTLRDTNEKLDVYEWNEGDVDLISTGISRDESGLVTVSADGVDAFFYTRETLESGDNNGNNIRIYDAREDGGFLVDPDIPPCAAADECRGAGTQAPGPANINSRTGAGPRAATSELNNRCKGLARRAKKNSNRAKRLRRKASKSSNGRRTRQLRRNARKAAKQARRLSRRAKACRRSSGGNG